MLKRATIAPALATVGLLAAGQRPAEAGGPRDPLLGDLDGDGIGDRATLSVGGPETCTVTVELGDGSGGYGLPTVHSFARPGTVERYCPDMGVIVDLGDDGRVELVLTWFFGPFGYPHELLVLRDYTPTGGFDGLAQPSEIGLADFNGDGLQDVYEWSDQQEGLRTYLNTAGSELVPGPVKLCFRSRPRTLEFADFDGDGATDVLLSYPVGCGDDPGGVSVILDDGTDFRLLTSEFPGYPIWTTQVVDAHQDGVLDVLAVNGGTGEIQLFLGDGAGSFKPK
jgi:FG-GAP-like repeat